MNGGVGQESNGVIDGPPVYEGPKTNPSSHPDKRETRGCVCGMPYLKKQGPEQSRGLCLVFFRDEIQESKKRHHDMPLVG